MYSNNYNSIDKQINKKQEQQQPQQHSQNKKINKTHIINIDSFNRQKNTKIISEPINNFIVSNGIEIINSNTIRIHHPKHNLIESNINQIILTNIEGDYIQNTYSKTIGGIPLKYLNYNVNNNGPFHNIKIIPKLIHNKIIHNKITNNIESDYYEITITNILNLNNIIIGYKGGGDNINVKRILDLEQGYKYASHFKISLGNIYRNIISARLISIELKNTQLAIQNSKPKLQNQDILVNNDNFNEANDTFYWINKDEKIIKYDIRLESDNRINNKIILNQRFASKQSQFQINHWNQEKYNWMSNIISINNDYDSNSKNYLFWPKKFIRGYNNIFNKYIFDIQSNKIKNLILSEIDSLNLYTDSDNEYINWDSSLDNIKTLSSSNNIKLITDEINNIIIKQISDTTQQMRNNSTITLFTRNDSTELTFNNNKYIYKFLNKLCEYYNNYKYFESKAEGVPYKLGYWEIQEEINTNSNYIISKTNIGQIILTPISNGYNDNQQITPVKTFNNVNKYELYPIYKAIIDQGTYNNNNFINEAEKKLNNIQKKDFNFNTNTFENSTILNKLNIKLRENYSSFKFNIEPNKNILKIRQYKDIFNYSFSNKLTEDNQGPFYINEGFRNIFLEHKDHILKTGDVIYIEGSSNLSNVSSAEINKEHIVNVPSVYSCSIRPLLPIPNNYEVPIDSNYYYYYGYKLLDYASYKNSNGPLGLGNPLISVNNNSIKQYELILKLDELNNKHNLVIGRINKVDTAEINNNITITYDLLSDANFKIGDIIISSVHNFIGMIVPENYNNTNLYLKEELNILNSSEKIIPKLNNLSSGYTINSITIPNRTSLTGIGGTNVNIKQPIAFSLLFEKSNTIYKPLGFNKENTEFNTEHSNTEKINNINIDFSYLSSNTSNNNKFRYVTLKTLEKTNYEIGSRIYIDNHNLISSKYKEKPKIKLEIDSYETVENWYNSLNYTDSVLYKNLKNNYNNKIIIHYSYPYNLKQHYNLGNLGNTIEQYEHINYFDNNLISTLPNIFRINKENYIYLYNLQNNNASITSIPDGYYKVIENLPKLKSQSLYNFYNKNTNSIIIDAENNNLSIDFNISNTFLNRGFIRSPTFETEIVGFNNNFVSNNISLNRDYIVDINANNREIFINTSSNIQKNQVIIFNTKQINNNINNINNNLDIKDIEINIIEKIDDIINENVTITNKITCKYPILNNHLIGAQIYVLGYVYFNKNTLYKNENSIEISTDITNNIAINNIIKIDWNNVNEEINYIEAINYINGIDDSDGKTIITLKYPLKYIHSINSCIYIIENDITKNNLSTQNIYMNNKWYTQIFYNGIKPFEDKSHEGEPYITSYLSNSVHINNNKGIYIPNKILTVDGILDSDDNIELIHPIPDGHYDTITYNDPEIVYNINTSSPICGNFNILNNNSWEPHMSIYPNYNCITIEGKYNGFDGIITQHYESTDHIINYHSGFVIKNIIQKQSYDLITLELNSNNLNIIYPEQLITDITELSDEESFKYKIGFSGNIYQKQLLNELNIQGDKYIYMSINNLDNIITNNSILTDKAFAKILLNSKIGTNIFNSFINNRIQFLEGALPILDEIEVKFFNSNGKLFDFNNQDVSFTLELITEEEILNSINQNSNYLN